MIGMTSFMKVERMGPYDEYYSVEMYKADDCTGVAHVNGIMSYDGYMKETAKSGGKFVMRDTDWGAKVTSFKLHKNLDFSTFSDWN